MIASYRTRLASDEDIDANWPGLDLAPTDRWLLMGLLAGGQHDLAAQILRLIYEAADERFGASGASAWINDTRRPEPTSEERAAFPRPIQACLRLAARGLGWLSLAADIDPTAARRIREAAVAGERAFYRVGWLTIAGGVETLGLSPYFDDAASSVITARDRVAEKLAAL